MNSKQSSPPQKREDEELSAEDVSLKLELAEAKVQIALLRAELSRVRAQLQQFEARVSQRAPDSGLVNRRVSTAPPESLRPIGKICQSAESPDSTSLKARFLG